MKKIFKALCAFALCWGLSIQISNAADFVEGKDYIKISEPNEKMRGSGGKVLVTEFFWYGCPHCYGLQKPLSAWVEKRNQVVQLKSYPAVFSAKWEPMAKAYFANELIGGADKEMHKYLFGQVFELQKKLDEPKNLFLAIEEKRGSEYRKKYEEAYNSFSMSAKLGESRLLSKSLKLEGTPSIVIQGQWLLTVSSAGSQERMLEIADWLVQIELENAKNNSKRKK